MNNIVVYCGSNLGEDPCYSQAARELGRAIAERGSRLVYGGGGIGLMGEVASAALAAGGKPSCATKKWRTAASPSLLSPTIWPIGEPK